MIFQKRDKPSTSKVKKSKLKIKEDKLKKKKSPPRKMYSCPMCDHMFNSAQDLKKHSLEHQVKTR